MAAGQRLALGEAGEATASAFSAVRGPLFTPDIVQEKRKMGWCRSVRHASLPANAKCVTTQTREWGESGQGLLQKSQFQPAIVGG